MKKPSHVLEYPLVVRKVLDSLTISVPDLGIFSTISMPPKVKIENGYVTQYNDEYALKLGREILRTYGKASKHMNEKKWVPNASDIKSVIEKRDKPFTVPAFAKMISQAYPISQDTIRRDIEVGVIKCAKTSGGHRRIPASEAGRYLSYLEGKITYKKNMSLVKVMEDIEKKRLKQKRT